MEFHEVRFPPALSFGSVGGPQRRTNVVTLANGFEERNTPWAHSRRVYDAGMGMRSLDDVQEAIAFFEARFGQMYAFRWKDWSDFKSCKASSSVAATDQVIGTGDGTNLSFSLTKTYASGAHDYVRPIKKPVAGTVLVSIEQDVQIEGQNYEVDLTSGLVQFVVPPPSGARIQAGYEFDVPVRFDSDRIMTSVASFRAGQVPDIPVIEVRV